MKELTKNAINILGENGIAWIDALPTVIEKIFKQWKLKNITSVENMSYHYVAKAWCSDGKPVVLKIGFDKKAILDEKQALSYFDGNAAIRLLDYDEQYNALLLEQAIPGTTLKSFYPIKDEFVIDCYVNTVKTLLCKSSSSIDQFRPIKDWLKALDAVQLNRIPNALLQRAIDLKAFLLSTMTKEVVLHGDLHHDNILKNNDTWIVIDPKGIVGEPEFEMAAFDFIHADEIDNSEIKKLFHRRLNLMAEKSKLSAERIKNWVFVRLILSAAWHVEDKGNPNWAIALAEKLI
jgi:streptomycin 6-kinase